MTDPINIGPRSLGATLAATQKGSFGLAMGAFGLGPTDWETGKKLFFFHRHKDRKTGRWGVDIWLHVDAHGMNLTCYGIAPFPRRLDDARGWAIDFAKAHGFVAMTRPKRKPHPRLTLVRGGKAP